MAILIDSPYKNLIWTGADTYLANLPYASRLARVSLVADDGRAFVSYQYGRAINSYGTSSPNRPVRKGDQLTLQVSGVIIGDKSTYFTIDDADNTSVALTQWAQFVQLQSAVSQLQQGSATGGTGTGIPVTTWIDGSAMTLAKCNGKQYWQASDGTFYRKPGPATLIDLGDYLLPTTNPYQQDGQGNYTSPDNLKVWNDFNAYWAQMSQPIKLALWMPSASYYSSDTLRFSGRQYHFMGWGKHYFPSHTLGVLFAGTDNSDYSGDLRVFAMASDYGDGRVPKAGGEEDFLKSMGFDYGYTTYGGGTAGDADSAGTVRSTKPDHYKCHGIMACCVTNFGTLQVQGFSGHGFYRYGLDIGRADSFQNDGTYPDGTAYKKGDKFYNTTFAPDFDGAPRNLYFAPSRYNTSGSSLQRCFLADNGGAGLVDMGVDANASSCGTGGTADFRTNGLWGWMDLSQSGCNLYNGQTAINRMGGYCMLSAKWVLNGCYQETDAHTTVVGRQSGSRQGGILSSNISFTEGVFNQDGAGFDVISVNSLHASRLKFGTYGGTTMEWHVTGTGSLASSLITSTSGPRGRSYGHFGLVVDPGQGSPDGRVAGVPATVIAANVRSFYPGGADDFKEVQILSKKLVNVDGFNPPLNQLFFAGDELINSYEFYTPHGPNRWQAQPNGQRKGQWGAGTWETLGGPTLNWKAGSNQQIIQFSTPCGLVQLNDYITVNGQLVQMLNGNIVQDFEARMWSEIFLSQRIDTADPPKIEFARIRFAAVLESIPSGTVAERVSLQAGGDFGFPYFATDLNGGTLQHWNGTAYV